MPSTNVSHPHETLPVGKTEEDQKPNAELLAGYDYEKYNQSLTGFTGQTDRNLLFSTRPSEYQGRMAN